MIKIENLYKSYGQGQAKVEVLKNIDLDIEKGKIICILGPSGSGKSTLLNIIGGIAVSYTHLDVYKRQGHMIALQGHHKLLLGRFPCQSPLLLDLLYQNLFGR